MIFGVVVGAIIAAAVAVPVLWFGVRALRRTPWAALPGAVAGLAAGLTLGPVEGAVLGLGATAAARTGILLWRGEREAARSERTARVEPVPPKPEPQPPIEPAREPPYLVVSGGRVFHREGCPSVAKLRRGTVTRHEWEDLNGRGLEPCLICRPSRPSGASSRG